MEVITEYGNYWDLKDHSWSGALDTLADIERADKEDELMEFLEEIFADRTPTDAEVNDLLWHDREYVYENVGLDSDGEFPVNFDSVGAGVTQKYLDYVSDEFWSECPTRLCFNMEEVTKEVINDTDYTKVVLSLDGEGLKEEMFKEEYDKENKTLWSRFQAKGNTITIIVLDRITRNDLNDIGDFLDEIQDKFEED